MYRAHDIPAGREPANLRALRDAVQIQGVQQLVHFTPVENIPSILSRGLRGRRNLEVCGVPVVVTDSMRLDGLQHCISLSVSFPNHKMFYAKRNTLTTRGWVVLTLDPALIWESPEQVFFFPTNAASHTIRGRHDLTPFTHANAFYNLFGTLDDVPPRPFLTFDPQAEVMVANHVDRRYITGLCTEDNQTLRLLRDVCGVPGHLLKVEPKLFQSRDYVYPALRPLPSPEWAESVWEDLF